MSNHPVPPVVEQEVLAPYRDPVAALDDIGIEHRCDAAVAAARAAVVADPDALSLCARTAHEPALRKRSRDDTEVSVPDAVERHLLRCETAIAAAVQALRAERVCRASFIKTMEAFRALPEAESHVDMADERQAEAVDFFTRKVAFSICRSTRVEVKEGLTSKHSICEVVVNDTLRVATVGDVNEWCREWTTSFGPAASSGAVMNSWGARFHSGTELASRRDGGTEKEPTNATVSKAMELLPQESPLRCLPWKAFGLLMQIASLTALCDDDEWEGREDRYGGARAFTVKALCRSNTRACICPYRDPVAALDDIGIQHRCDAAVAAARAAVVADPNALSLTSYSAESTYRVKRGRDEGEEDNVPDAVERHLLHIEATAAAAVQALRAERVCRASFIKTMRTFKALPEAESHVDMADERQAEAVDFFTRKVAFSMCRVARIEIKDNVTDRFTMCEAVIHGSLRVGTVGVVNDSISLHRGWSTSFGPAASSGIQIGRYDVDFHGGNVLAADGEQVRFEEPTKATVAKAMKHLPQESPLHALSWKALALLMQIASLIVLCEEEWEYYLDERPERLGAAKAVAVFARAHGEGST